MLDINEIKKCYNRWCKFFNEEFEHNCQGKSNEGLEFCICDIGISANNDKIKSIDEFGVENKNTLNECPWCNNKLYRHFDYIGCLSKNCRFAVTEIIERYRNCDLYIYVPVVFH